MKKLYSIIFFIAFFTCTANAQSPNWLWAKSAGGHDEDEGISATTDLNGNVYVTGRFRSYSITFGTITLNNATSSGYNYYDAYIVKYDSSGNVLWAKGAGGNQHDEGLGITTDGKGNVYMSGKFQSNNIIFGNDTLKNTFTNRNDLFIVKYDSSGNVLWARSAGGTNDDLAESIACGPNGSVYMTGNFNSPSIIFGTTTLNTNGGQDMFIAKYDSIGNVLWAINGNGSGNDYGLWVTTDRNGYIYATGYFAGSSLTFESTKLNNAGGSGFEEIYVVKYDQAGNLLWAKRAGGSDHDISNSITVDRNGNSYITGSFKSPSIGFGTTVLNNNTYGDVFIAKYDPNGNALWAKKASGSNYEEGTSVVTDSSGYLYAVGYFGSASLNFGPFTITGGTGTYIAKYDSNGIVLWVQRTGKSTDGISCVTKDNSENVYITGLFTVRYSTFGTTTLINTDSCNCIADMFIAKLNNQILTEITATNIESKWNVFPNPTTGFFTIKSPEKISAVEIENILGEKIYSSHIEFYKSEIDLRKQPNGIYFMQIKTSGGIENKKMIIQK